MANGLPALVRTSAGSGAGVEEGSLMNDSELRQFIRKCPVLYHVTASGSWYSIKEHGLLSTNALLDNSTLEEGESMRIRRNHRPECVTVQGKGSHRIPLKADIRDQIPMNDKTLRRQLEAQKAGITAEEWYERQNDRVFFFVSREAAVGLMTLYAERGRPQCMLEVCTKSLFKACYDKIELSEFNTGSNKQEPDVPKKEDGKWHGNLRKPWREYPARKRDRKNVVKELTVPGGIPDIARHVINVVDCDGEVTYHNCGRCCSDHSDLDCSDHRCCVSLPAWVPRWLRRFACVTCSAWRRLCCRNGRS